MRQARWQGLLRVSRLMLLLMRQKEQEQQVGQRRWPPVRHSPERLRALLETLG